MTICLFPSPMSIYIESKHYVNQNKALIGIYSRLSHSISRILGKVYFLLLLQLQSVSRRNFEVAGQKQSCGPLHDPSVCKKMLMHIPVTLFAYKHRLCSVTTTIYYTSVGKRYEKVFLFGRAAKRCMVPVIPRELKTWPGRGMSSGHTSLFFSVNNCNSM